MTSDSSMFSGSQSGGDEDQKIAFEKIIKEKYRIKEADMGGLHKSQHWIEELKKPLVIS